jgi:hypothetical protein
MKYLIALVVCASFLSNAFLSSLFLSSNAVASPAPEVVEFFSFEQDFEGWTPEMAGAPGAISRSQDRAIDGETSIKLDVHPPGEVITSAVWIQRGFTLTPNETYQVQVRYFLAARDGGAEIGGTNTMAGATSSPPSTLSDALTFLEDFVRSDKSPRYQWLLKEYEFTARTDDAGALSIMTGVLAGGVFLSYYIDGIRIKFTRKQAGSVQPIISAASRLGKRLTIQGSGFGTSPRVIINDVDRSDFIVAASDNSTTLRGSQSSLGLTRSHNKVRVVDDNTAAASEPFDLFVP